MTRREIEMSKTKSRCIAVTAMGDCGLFCLPAELSMQPGENDNTSIRSAPASKALRPTALPPRVIITSALLLMHSLLQTTQADVQPYQRFVPVYWSAMETARKERASKALEGSLNSTFTLLFFFKPQSSSTILLRLKNLCQAIWCNIQHSTPRDL